MPVAGSTAGPNLAGPNPVQTGIDGVMACVRSTYLACFNASSYICHNAGAASRDESRDEDEGGDEHAAQSATAAQRQRMRRRLMGPLCLLFSACFARIVPP